MYLNAEYGVCVTGKRSNVLRNVDTSNDKRRKCEFTYSNTFLHQHFFYILVPFFVEHPMDRCGKLQSNKLLALTPTRDIF